MANSKKVRWKEIIVFIFFYLITVLMGFVDHNILGNEPPTDTLQAVVTFGLFIWWKVNQIEKNTTDNK